MAGEREVSFVVRVKDAGSAVLRQVGDSASHTVEKIFSLKDILKDLVGAAAAFSVGELVKSIVELGIESDKTFRQIAANLPTFTEGLKELKEGIEDLAASSGRSLQEMEQSAGEIAKLGVSSAEELKQQLEAATLLADASGASVDESAHLLIQLRREFHLTGEEALETAAKIFSVSRGKASISELLSAFEASAPIFQKFNIDVDTGARAIAALVQNGYTTTRQIRTALSSMPDGASIRQIAESAHIAANYMEEMATAAHHVEDGTGRAAERVRSDFSKELETLGTLALPLINSRLKELTDLLEALNKIDVPKFFKIAFSQIDPLAGLDKYALRLASDAQLVAAGYSIEDVRGKAPDKPKPRLPAGFKSAIPDAVLHPDGGFKLPPTKEEIAQAEEARKKLEALRLELQSLLQTTEEGKSKSEQFADAIGRYQVKAHEAGKSTAEIQADVARLNGVLDVLSKQEATKQIAEDAKAAQEAFQALNDAIASLSGDPIAQIDAQLQTTLDKLDKNRKELERQRDEAVGAAAVTGGDPSAAAAATQQLDDFNAGVQRIKDSYTALRAAVAETVATEKEFGPLQQLLEAHKVTAGQLVTAFDQFKAAEADVQAKQKAAMDPKVAAEYGRELQFIQSILKLIDRDWSDMFAPAENHKNQVVEIAAAWATVARTILGAVQALGKVSNATAAIVTDVVNAGEGIAKIFGDKKGEGATEALSSIGGLINVISNMGHAASQAQQRAAELTAEMDKLFQGIADELSATKGNSLAELIAKAQQDFADKRNTIERDLGGKKNQTEREKALDKLTADEAAYIEMLKQEDAAKQQQLQEDYHVRALRAKGLDLEADALEFAERQQREYTAAVSAGDDAMTLAALHTAQTAEAIEHAVKSHLAAALAAVSQSDQIHHVDTSTTAGAVQSFSEKAQQYSAIGGALGDLFHGLDLNHLSPEQIVGLDTSIQDLFDQLKTAPDSVDTAGLSINDFINALLDLSGAATSVASTIKSAAQQISDAENQISVADSILGTSGIQSVNEYASAYGIDLSPFEDVTNPDKPAITKQGRDQAIEYLRNLFKGLDKTNPSYSLTSHEIQTLIQGLSGLSFDAGADSGGGIAGIPSFRDSYHDAAVGTVTGISDAEASGILGELATANTYLSTLPDIRELLSVRVSDRSLYGGAAPGAWQSSMGQRLGSGIGAAIGSSLGSAAAGAFADAAGSGAPINVNVILDGKVIAQAVSDAYLDPGSYQQLDRANARAVNRARAGAGLAKKK